MNHQMRMDRVAERNSQFRKADLEKPEIIALLAREDRVAT